MNTTPGGSQPLILWPALYDHIAALGWDMRFYARIEPIPTTKEPAMGESIDSLMRRGAISAKAAKGTGVAPKRATTVNKGDGDPDFDEKGGARDQGGIRDRGHQVATKDHINRSDKNERGMPSKGGRVNNIGQFHRDEIDARESQGPDFPREGSRPSAKGAKRRVGRDAPGRSSGPQYGGPSSRRDG